MINKYKQYVKESISNTDYKYPFGRILILINNVDEYYMVVKFIEDNFNIKINDERDYYNYPVDKVFTHVLLSVQLLYSIKNGNYEKIDDHNLLRFYTNLVLSNDELINYISCENNDGPYFYEKDVLNVNQLNDINSLLNNGNRGSYKSIYKQNINVYESKIIESLSPINDKSVDGYIYYTKSLNETEMKEIYQILFDNGYSLGSTTDVDELRGDELENSLLFIFEKNKKLMFSTNSSIRNNITDISNYTDDYTILNRIIWYLIKDMNDLKKVFKKTISINDFIKPNINVYESLLNKLEGPSEQEIIDGIKKNPNVNLWKYWVDGDLDIIKKIIGYGANPNYKDGSLLLNAIGDKGFKRQPNIDFVKFLIEHGADVNIHNGEPLRYACHDYDEQKWDNLELIKILLDAGADIHSMGDFCMQIAKAHNQPKLINFLNDYMKPINKEKVFKFKKFLGIKESLLDKISGPTEEEIWNEIKNYSPNNMFAKSCEIGFFNGVKKSMKLGADIFSHFEYTSYDTDEISGLEYLIKNDNIEIFKYVFNNYNKKINQQYELDSYLEISAYYGKEEFVKFLIEKGADVNDEMYDILGFINSSIKLKQS